MENASKALIIAGSVLVTIMVIALGVTIFNKAHDAADTSGLDTTEITMFNSKFERYANNQSGSQVKSLMSFAISNASTNKDEPMKLPSFNLNNPALPAHGATDSGFSTINDYISQLTSIRQAIISTSQYNVTFDYFNDGLISQITITKQ